MNFRKSLFFIASALCINVHIACDLCGCFMGITPYDNQSQIAFLHRYRAFNGYVHHQKTSNLFTPGAYKIAHGGTTTDSVVKTYSSRDFESYKVFELRGKYFIHKRIELNGILPFVNNKYKEGEEKGSVTGIGDPTIFAGVHVLRRVDTVSFQQRLIVGGGMKIPSGNYYAAATDGDRLPFLLQPGTGSVDGFLYANYILGYKNFGTSINVLYKINGENYYKEKIGNSVSTYCNIFLRYMRANVSVMPSVQFYHEFTKGLYKNGFEQEGTGMNVLMAGPGCDVFYKNFGFNLSVQLRVYEKTHSENLKTAGRIVAGVNYNFNQKKYLLKRREPAAG